LGPGKFLPIFFWLIIAKTNSVPGNKGLGVLYWEPESYNGWQGYTRGPFDNSGKPTVALNALIEIFKPGKILYAYYVLYV